MTFSNETFIYIYIYTVKLHSGAKQQHALKNVIISKWLYFVACAVLFSFVLV